MKLQKQLSRRYNGKDYPKWLVIIPPGVVKELGWQEGEGLEPLVDGKDLRLRRQRRS